MQFDQPKRRDFIADVGIDDGRVNKGARRAPSIMLDPEELDAVDDFRFKKRMPSRAAAVRELLKRTAAVGAKSSAYGVTGKTPVGRK